MTYTIVMYFSGMASVFAVGFLWRGRSACQKEAMVVCRTCGKQNRADAHFCKTCGADLNARICTSCGQSNRSNAPACTRCGKVLVQICSHCKHENKLQARFCQLCGTTLNRCPHCGATNRPGARFCKQCGRDPTNLHVQPLPTDLLNQRYKILRLIARGGMGAVYEVSDVQKPTQSWALKEMSLDNVDATEQQDAIIDFRREALLLRKLDHPNLVKVIDNFSQAGKEYLVMEYVRGEMLDTFLNHKPRTEASVLPLAFQLCNVLEYLHAQTPPIIYRDLKPGNAMIETDSGIVKLIDFGIARFYKPGQQKDTKLLGTPGFAPPEQYGKGQTDARSDIFTLGVTLHVLLTDYDVEQNPWNYPPASTLNPLVSTYLEQVIGKAVEMAVDKRYQSVVAMRQALLNCADGKQIARQLPTNQRAPTPKPPARASPGPALVIAPPPVVVSTAALSVTVSPSALHLKVHKNATIQEQFQLKSNNGAGLAVQLTTSATWLEVMPEKFTGALETIAVHAYPMRTELPRVQRPTPNWLAKAWTWAESKGARRNPGANSHAIQMTLLIGLPALLVGSLAYALTWAVYQHAYFFVPGVSLEHGQIKISYGGGGQTIPVTLEVAPAQPNVILGWLAAWAAVVCEVAIFVWLL